MKIAIVKLSAMGDIVHAMVALQFIKAALPAAEIDWVVEQGFAELLNHNPHIRRVLPVNLKALKTDKSQLLAQWRLVKRYAQEDYDWVIDAQGLLKSAAVARLLSGNCAGFDRASIRERLAAAFYRRTVACPYEANTIDRNVKVLTEPLNISVSRQDILDKQPFLFFSPPGVDLTQFLASARANILLVIGSTWASRNYPVEQFLQVMQSLPANYLVCWGSDAERQAAEWLGQHGGALVLPRLNLNDLKAVIARVDLLIGNDTGPTHMAWGLNRPSITLFGPTPVSRVYQTAINKVLKSPSAVNPLNLNKQDFSIREIQPQAIVELAKSLLQHS